MKFIGNCNISRQLPLFLCIFCTFAIVSNSRVSLAQSPNSSTSQQQLFSVDWNTIAQIATALGVGIATISIYSSYQLYQLSRRDEYAKNLRRSILLNQDRCHRLNASVNHELTNEMVNCVVYSKDLEIPLKEIFIKFFNPPSTEKKEELKKHIEEFFPSITVPIRSPLLVSYDTLIFDISSDLALYQIEAPGFHRVMLSLKTLFRNIENRIKEILGTEDIWKEILSGLLEDNDIQDFDKLRYRLSTIFIHGIRREYLSQTQKNIDNLLEISSIVSDAYLSLTEDKLVKLTKIEKQQILIPVSKTVTIIEDLQEADKCLLFLLDSDALRKYRELVVRYDERSKSKES
jgi:hypothetical protein